MSEIYDDDESWIQERVGLDRFEQQSAQRGYSMPDFWWVREGATPTPRGVLVDGDLNKVMRFDLHRYMVPNRKGQPRPHYESCILQKYPLRKLAELGYSMPPCCANPEMRPIDQSMDRNTAFYTIVDGTKFQDSNGNERQFEMRLFPINAATMKLMKRLNSEWKHLNGWVVKFSRDSEKAPRVGGTWERDVDQATSMLSKKDLTKLFGHAMFRGKKLTTLFDDADREIAERSAELAEAEKELAGAGADPVKVAELAEKVKRLREPGDKARYVLHYFKVKIIDGKVHALDSNGQPHPVARTVPVFNYAKIFTPKSPDEFVRIHGTGGAMSTGVSAPDPVKTGKAAAKGATANKIGSSDDDVAF